MMQHEVKIFFRSYNITNDRSHEGEEKKRTFDNDLNSLKEMNKFIIESLIDDYYTSVLVDGKEIELTWRFKK